MILILRWKWLCRIGIHEWTIEYLGDQLYADYWECDMCGKRKGGEWKKQPSKSQS